MVAGFEWPQKSDAMPDCALLRMPTASAFVPSKGVATMVSVKSPVVLAVGADVCAKETAGKRFAEINAAAPRDKVLGSFQLNWHRHITCRGGEIADKGIGQQAQHSNEAQKKHRFQDAAHSCDLSLSARLIIKICSSPPRTCRIMATAERLRSRRSQGRYGRWSASPVSISCSSGTDTVYSKSVTERLSQP